MSLHTIYLLLLLGVLVVASVFFGAVRGIFRPKSLPLLVILARELLSRRKKPPQRSSGQQPADGTDPPDVPRQAA